MTVEKKKKPERPNFPTIKDFVSAVGYMLDCGYEYRWDCYGPEACGIGWTSGDAKASAVMIYDAKDGRVFEIGVWDDDAPNVLRWIRPGFGAKYRRESRSKGHDPAIAIDRVRFKEVSAEDALVATRRLFRRKKRV